MTSSFVWQIVVVLAVILAVGYVLGIGMAAIFDGRPSWLDPVCAPIERLLLAITGVRGSPAGMTWSQYALAIVWSNFFMAVIVFGVLLFQGHLPLNPLHLPDVEPMLAFGTACSFVTNTNWQAYSGESTLSYLSQMALTFLMFTTAGTGIVAAIAMIRGLVGRADLGNFYQDLIRLTVRLLMPVSVVFALFLCWQGVPQTLASSAQVRGPQGIVQTIPRGPVASLESIKEFGTNGGGYYNANSAHPLEGPTPLSSAVEIVLLLAIPVGVIFTFGAMLRNQRQALVVLGVMGVIYLCGLATVAWAETHGNPMLTHLGVNQAAGALSPGGNLEGKEVRFGQALSVLFAVSTTATMCGAVNCMHDSLTALGGFVPLGQMMLNSVFGGVGVGFMNFMLFGVLAVFLTGLMVGRTPEIFGKKVEKPEIVLASLIILLHPLLILAPSAWSILHGYALASLDNRGFHGLSEILYAYSSAAANNGSAFAGLNADTPWYLLSQGFVMLLGRYLPIIAQLAIAGSLLAKRPVPVGPGTLRTDTALFGALWLAVILIVGALTFFPVMALGPIAEHFAMLAGKTF
ncbi:MAG TPA: potassium-transporting ATPase subunit KdpA [Oscillatoriaceae cyanobacterium]